MSEGEARRPRVVIVEDDSDIASLLTDVLDSEGYHPIAVGDAAALEAQLDPRPDLILLDLRLTRGGAEDIVGSLRGRGVEVPILLLSAATDLPERAQQLGLTSYIAKPFELDTLLSAVRKLSRTS